MLSLRAFTLIYTGLPHLLSARLRAGIGFTLRTACWSLWARSPAHPAQSSAPSCARAAVECSLPRSHQEQTVSYAAGSRAVAAGLEFPCHSAANSPADAWVDGRNHL